MSYKILGIEVERRTDILAFAAFVISLGSMVTQAINLIKGPDIQLEPPRQVLFHLHPYPEGKRYLRISSKMTYINRGSPGYDDILKAEKAYVFIGKKRIELMAQEYTHSGVEAGQLTFEKKSDADPVQIKSGSVVTHETYFAPWPGRGEHRGRNFLESHQFIELLENHKQVRVKFEAISFDGAELYAQCRLKTDDFIAHIKHKFWSAPVCLESI